VWEHSRHFRRQVADVSSNMDLYTQEFVDMNAALPRKRSPLLKLFNLSFTFYQVSQKSCTCECVVSAGIRWCFCCHLAIFHGVVDMVHLKITLLKRNIKISSKTPWESGFQLRGEKV